MDRSNHYEAAFEAYLQWHRLCYVAVDERRGYRVALIAGPDEFAQGVWKLKHLAKREEITVPSSEVQTAVRQWLQ